MSKIWKDEIAAALAVLQRGNANPEHRLAACVLLAQYGVTEGLDSELEALSATFPRAAVWRRTVRQLERTGLGRPLPRIEADGNVADELLENLGVMEKAVPGSDTLVLVFGGVNHRLGLSFDIVQRILRPTGASTLYLRDLERTWYAGGIVGMGATFCDSVRAIQNTIRRLRAARVLAIGNCLGCAGAVQYGLAIGFDAILGLSPRLRIPDRLSCFDPLRGDVRDAYAAAEPRPRLTLVYGEDCPEDADEVAHMAGVDGVVAAPIAHYDGHACLALLFARGLLTRLLRGFVRSGVIGGELLADIARAAG